MLRPGRPGAVILRAIAHEEIICTPCLLGRLEGEFIVDPRGLEIHSEPAGAQMADLAPHLPEGAVALVMAAISGFIVGAGIAAALLRKLMNCGGD